MLFLWCHFPVQKHWLFHDTIMLTKWKPKPRINARSNYGGKSEPFFRWVKESQNVSDSWHTFRCAWFTSRCNASFLLIYYLRAHWRCFIRKWALLSTLWCWVCGKRVHTRTLVAFEMESSRNLSESDC